MRFAPVALLGLLLTAPVAQAADTAVIGRSITVGGDAEIKRAPDKVDVSIGIQEQRRDLAEARKATDEQLKALYRIAKETGIAEKDLRTDYSSVQPVYDYNNGKRIFTGYSVTHQVTATLRAADKLADFTQKLLDAKIDQIDNIVFGLQKEDDARQEALKLAIAKARQKAEILARSEGESLGKVYSINEAGMYFEPVPLPMLRGKAMMAMDAAAPAMQESASPPAGEISVRAEVQATFLLKD